VLEDLLRSPKATHTAYLRLYKEVRRHLPKVDSRALAWHITIPQYPHTPSRSFKTANKIPQYDNIICNYCDANLRIPLLTPRYHEKTLKAYREVFYAPSGTQSCDCGNLKTFTDDNWMLRVYLQDNNDDAFRYMHGPIDLMEATTYTSRFDTDLLLDSPRPTTKNPFHFENRDSLRLNHINLYKVSPQTIAALMPYEDLKEYARAYNIVIYLTNTVVFPSGHEFSYRYLKAPQYTFSNMLSKHIVDFRRAEVLNAFTENVYQHLLPKAIQQAHNSQVGLLSRRLGIPKSYAPMSPIVPFMQRLGYANTDKSRGFPTTIAKPLGMYKELHILRLPRFVTTARHQKVHQQDFQNALTHSPPSQESPRLPVRREFLQWLKHERIRMLQYLLPRTQQSPSTILRYADTHLHYLQVPAHTPINHTLIKLIKPPQYVVQP